MNYRGKKPEVKTFLCIYIHPAPIKTTGVFLGSQKQALHSERLQKRHVETAEAMTILAIRSSLCRNLHE